MTNLLKARLKFLFQFGIGIGILIVVIHFVNWSQIFQGVKSASLTWLLMALLINSMLPWLQAWRWRVSWEEQQDDDKPSFKTFLRYTRLGVFLAFALPSGGSELLRGVALARQSGDAFASIGSTILGKLIGVLAVCLAFWPFVFAIPSGHFQQLTGSMLLPTLGAASLFVFALPLSWRQPLQKLIPEKWGKWRRLIAYGRPLTFWYCLGISLLIQANMVVVNWMLYRAVHLDVSLWEVGVYAPIIVLAVTLPISFLGIGVREAATIALYCNLSHWDKATVLSAGILAYALVTMQMISSGCLYWWHGRSILKV